MQSKRTEIVNAVVGHFGSRNKELTEHAIEAWADALAPFTVAQVRAALTGWNRNSRYLPRPDEIVNRISGRGEGEAGPSGPCRCSFTHNGQRCPFTGYFEIQHGKAEAGQLCIGHDELRRDRGASIRYLEAALAGRVTWLPADEAWVDTCRKMLDLHGEDALLRHSDAGHRMLGYLQANPTAGVECKDNPWKLPDPREQAREIAHAEKYAGTREYEQHATGPVPMGEAAERYAARP